MPFIKLNLKDFILKLPFLLFRCYFVNDLYFVKELLGGSLFLDILA